MLVILMKIERRFRGTFCLWIFRCMYGSAIKIGNAVKVRSSIRIGIDGGGHLTIGNGVFFNYGVSINCRNKIVIGDDTLFGEGVKLYDHDHVVANGQPVLKNSFIEAPISIGSGCWIGSDVVILKGVSVGDNVVIAAGSIVTKDVPSNSVFVQKRESSIISK